MYARDEQCLCQSDMSVQFLSILIVPVVCSSMQHHFIFAAASYKLYSICLLHKVSLLCKPVFRFPPPRAPPTILEPIQHVFPALHEYRAESVKKKDSIERTEGTEKDVLGLLTLPNPRRIGFSA